MAEIATALRWAVRERASGRCEYCGVHEGFTLVSHEIDHVIAVKHGGTTESENLALSCTLCNKHKGSDVASLDPQTGRLEPLFHPRRDLWGDHFEVRAGETLIVSVREGKVVVGRDGAASEVVAGTALEVAAGGATRTRAMATPPSIGC